MNRQRLAAAIFFSVVILAVLGVIVGAEVVSGGQTVSVLRVRNAVIRGALFSAADVETVPLRIAPGDLNYITPGTVAPGSRYATSLQAGDLLQPDDLVSGTAEIAITVTVTDPPPLEVGEAVDLFVEVPGAASQVLIGHSLTIEALSGDSVTLLVSSQDELAWLEVVASNSTLKLYALAAVGKAPPGMPPDGVSQAICELAPSTCSSLVLPPSPPASPGAGLPLPSVSSTPPP